MLIDPDRWNFALDYYSSKFLRQKCKELQTGGINKVLELIATDKQLQHDFAHFLLMEMAWLIWIDKERISVNEIFLSELN